MKTVIVLSLIAISAAHNDLLAEGSPVSTPETPVTEAPSLTTQTSSVPKEGISNPTASPKENNLPSESPKGTDLLNNISSSILPSLNSSVPSSISGFFDGLASAAGSVIESAVGIVQGSRPNSTKINPSEIATVLQPSAPTSGSMNDPKPSTDFGVPALLPGATNVSTILSVLPIQPTGATTTTPDEKPVDEKATTLSTTGAESSSEAAVAATSSSESPTMQPTESGGQENSTPIIPTHPPLQDLLGSSSKQ